MCPVDVQAMARGQCSRLGLLLKGHVPTLPMTDPRDILGGDPYGVIVDRPDPRHYIVGTPETGSLSPFDWTKGYDIEEKITAANGKTFKMPVKDQGPSGSCGGQSLSYHAQALRSLYAGDTDERSAKYAYSQVYYPQGGSTFYDLGRLVTTEGVSTEVLCPSYRSDGMPLTEAEYDRPQDITDAAGISGCLRDGAFFRLLILARHRYGCRGARRRCRRPHSFAGQQYGLRFGSQGSRDIPCGTRAFPGRR